MQVERDGDQKSQKTIACVYLFVKTNRMYEKTKRMGREVRDQGKVKTRALV